MNANLSFSLKMLFGFILLTALVVLAGMIAIGKVEENTSAGLHDIIVTLQTLAGSFAGWMAGHRATTATATKKEATATAPT